MKRPALNTLPRGWRLSRAGKLVRDVVLLPGMQVQWLPANFDKPEDATVESIGRENVALNDPWEGPWPADEIYATDAAVLVALAARVAVDVRTGVTSCPRCRCRDDQYVRKSGRRTMHCTFCSQTWTVAPPTGGRR